MDTPEAAFAAAADAMRRQDWDAFFACLDRADLERIAGNSMALMAARLGEDPASAAVLAAELRLSLDALVTLGEASGAMTASAALFPSPEYDPERHRNLVNAYSAAIREAVRSGDDLARTVAALETRMRGQVGGGSVSDTLFVDEELVEVEVDGGKAWGVRRAGSWREEVGFVRRRGGWRIRLFARRPQRR